MFLNKINGSVQILVIYACCFWFICRAYLNVPECSQTERLEANTERSFIYKCFLSRLQYKIEKLVKPLKSVIFGFVTARHHY